MTRQRLYNQYTVLLLVGVISICGLFGAFGYRRLQTTIYDLVRQDAVDLVALVEKVIDYTGGSISSGAILTTPGRSVRIVSVPELRRELGFTGSLTPPVEFSTIFRNETGNVLLTVRSLDSSPLVLFSETSLTAVDRLLGDAVGALLVASILLSLSTAGFSVATVRSLRAAVYRLDDAVAQFAAGNFGHRARVLTPPALAALAGRLNAMAARVETDLTRITRRRNELEGILTSMVEGVIVLDTAKRITAMNASAARLFAVDPTAAQGQPLISFLRNSEVESFADDALTGGEPKERAITLFDIQPVHIQLHGTVIRNDHGAIIGALIVTSDITRIQRLETVRREFVANVSHELRTPITSILGFVETLQEGAIEDPDRARRFLEIVHAHANRLNLIIEDLLSLSRLESYDATIPVQRCQIHEIINSTKLSVGTAAAQKGISVEDSYSGQTEVTANATLLEQAIKNLMDNAIKYSPKGSVVRLSVRNRDGVLTVEVADNGLGIPASDLPRIFERFYRVDRARSRDLGGTGLGLAIVKHIAMAHGGSVTVNSIPGEGSTFVLSIPQDSEAL